MPQPTSPVGPHFGYNADTWAKLSLDYWSVCGIGSGSQLGCRKPTWPPVDIVWIYGLNWAWLSGSFLGYGVGPKWVQPTTQLGPSLDIVWIACALIWSLSLLVSIPYCQFRISITNVFIALI